MASYPILPLFTDALLSDTMHLTNTEFGVYLLLLCTAWRRPKCDLPDDDKFLASTARCTARKWPRMRLCMESFFTIENGVWIQKRLQKEREFILRFSTKQRENALVRWNKDKDLADATASVWHMPDRSQTYAPTPTPTEVSKNLFNGIGKTGWEKGRGKEGGVTVKNPDERINRFIVSLSRELDDPGMVIIGAACDLENENHDAALTLCKNAAHKLGKGWPRNWPTDHKIFERLTAKGDRTP